MRSESASKWSFSSQNHNSNSKRCNQQIQSLTLRRRWTSESFLYLTRTQWDKVQQESAGSWPTHGIPGNFHQQKCSQRNRERKISVHSQVWGIGTSRHFSHQLVVAWVAVRLQKCEWLSGWWGWRIVRWNRWRKAEIAWVSEIIPYGDWSQKKHFPVSHGLKGLSLSHATHPRSPHQKFPRSCHSSSWGVHPRTHF